VWQDSSFIEMEGTLDGRIAAGDFAGVPTIAGQEPVIVFSMPDVSASELSLETYNDSLGKLEANDNPVGVYADSPKGQLQLTTRDPLACIASWLTARSSRRAKPRPGASKCSQTPKPHRIPSPLG
jgi:hypothetical protein